MLCMKSGLHSYSKSICVHVFEFVLGIEHYKLKQPWLKMPWYTMSVCWTVRTDTRSESTGQDKQTIKENVAVGGEFLSLRSVLVL